MKKKLKTRYKFKSNYSKKKVNYKWIITITTITAIFAMVLSYFSAMVMEPLNIGFALIVLLLIVFIGVFFDMLGIAVTAATEVSFHSMASANIPGAKESIFIIRNASSFANFCNDVIGDIAGIISGSASSVILLKLYLDDNFKEKIFATILTGIIAALTVGGKAIAKEIALRNANLIVFKLGQLINFVKSLRR